MRVWVSKHRVLANQTPRALLPLVPADPTGKGASSGIGFAIPIDTGQLEVGSKLLIVCKEGLGQSGCG